MTLISLRRPLPRSLLALLLAGSLGTGAAFAGTTSDRPARVGVIVDGTRGYDRAAVNAARADVARRDNAELRVTRSPSESLAAAATLVTRGARTLIVYGVDDAAVLAPIRDAHPGVRIVRR